MRTPTLLRHVLPIAIVLLTCSTDVRAQGTRMGLHGGLNLDRSDAFIGLNGHVGISVSDRPVIAAVTAELYPFLDRASVTIVELDALLPGRMVGLDLYGGGGLVLRSASYDVPPNSDIDDSDTDFGLNVKGGIVFGDEYSGFRPFLEVDQTLGAGTDTVLRAGVFFILGGG